MVIKFRKEEDAHKLLKRVKKMREEIEEVEDILDECIDDDRLVRRNKRVNQRRRNGRM